jgi:hypothetical protein
VNDRQVFFRHVRVAALNNGKVGIALSLIHSFVRVDAPKIQQDIDYQRIRDFQQLTDAHISARRDAHYLGSRTHDALP